LSPRTLFTIAALSGFLSVALGAFAAHGLIHVIPFPELMETFQTGVRYQMFHTSALFAVGLLGLFQPGLKMKWLRWASYSFIFGILVFSGSLYILTITGVRWLGAITPIGGFAFLIGWGLTALWVQDLKVREDRA
jgi:uncharacterized membrane protein YgdD (TMEM256/DUF423 family)